MFSSRCINSRGFLFAYPRVFSKEVVRSLDQSWQCLIFVHLIRRPMRKKIGYIKTQIAWIETPHYLWMSMICSHSFTRLETGITLCGCSQSSRAVLMAVSVKLHVKSNVVVRHLMSSVLHTSELWASTSDLGGLQNFKILQGGPSGCSTLPCVGVKTKVPSQYRVEQKKWS